MFYPPTPHRYLSLFVSLKKPQGQLREEMGLGSL